MRIATPSLQWTFTTYSLPVSTGAPVCLIYARLGVCFLPQRDRINQVRAVS
jgi:hypothetical protein